MPRFAPRYDRRLVDAIGRFDDRGVPIAETCRRVGDYAARIGATRPSYVHLRRLILERRLREDERRELLVDALRLVYRPLRHDLDSVLDRVPHPFFDRAP